MTTDPARDTESVLAPTSQFIPDFVGVTGPISQINALGKPMGMYIKKGQKLPSGARGRPHRQRHLVHGGAGDRVWTANTSQSDMAADLKKILKADA